MSKFGGLLTGEGKEEAKALGPDGYSLTHAVVTVKNDRIHVKRILNSKWAPSSVKVPFIPHMRYATNVGRGA